MLRRGVEQASGGAHAGPAGVVAAGLAVSAADYGWSSHRAYLGLQTVPWLSTGLVLGVLAADAAATRRALAGLVDDGVYPNGYTGTDTQWLHRY
jgi:hypothetical protein